MQWKQCCCCCCCCCWAWLRIIMSCCWLFLRTRASKSSFANSLESIIPITTTTTMTRIFHTNYKRILAIIFSTASKLMCQFCLEVLHLAKRHPTPASKQQQASSTDLRAGEFLNDALGLNIPWCCYWSPVSQLVGWTGGMDWSSSSMFREQEWVAILLSHCIALHCCYFQWKISAMAAAAACLRDVWGSRSCLT